MIIPSLSGAGPPAIIVICQPVCSTMEVPIVASVWGSLSIALRTNVSHFFFEIWRRLSLTIGMQGFLLQRNHSVLGSLTCDSFGSLRISPVYATLIYHILVPAHGPDICTAVTAHHPNFSHLLYAAGDAGGG